MSGYLCLFSGGASAQIIPDNTLGPESSRPVPNTINNLPSDRITGGGIRGVNLFHSLREFNISEGRGAYFKNPSGITNIFTRVTGEKSSNILGTLGVLGNGNLFLINSNPKSFVNFLLPPLTKGRAGVGLKIYDSFRIAKSERNYIRAEC